MLESLASLTRVVGPVAADAAELDRALTYVVGREVVVGIVADETPLSVRDELVAALSSRRPTVVFRDVRPDPTVASVDAAVRALRAGGVGVVLGVGGGSTLDVAKVAAATLHHDGGLERFLGPAPEAELGARPVPLLLVPTTAGTGSEVTRFGVYTRADGRKVTLAHDALRADVALLVPALTATMPPALTAATGMDALSHALETLWNRNATSVSDDLAVRAARAVLAALPRAYASALAGGDEGRAEMLEAACMAGIAFDKTGTAACHALSFIFSEEWHVPHGTACALTLERVLAWNARDPDVRAKLATVATALWPGETQDSAPQRLVAHIAALRKEMSMPATFADLDVTITDGALSKTFARALEDPKMGNNAVPVDATSLTSLLPPLG